MSPTTAANSNSRTINSNSDCLGWWLVWIFGWMDAFLVGNTMFLCTYVCMYMKINIANVNRRQLWNTPTLYHSIKQHSSPATAVPQHETKAPTMTANIQTNKQTNRKH